MPVLKKNVENMSHNTVSYSSKEDKLDLIDFIIVLENRRNYAHNLEKMIEMTKKELGSG